MPRRSESKPPQFCPAAWTFRTLAPDCRTPHVVPSNRTFTRLVMRSFLTLSLMVSLLAAPPGAALGVEILRSAGGLPPHIVGTFEDPVDFQQAAGGTYYVF